TRRTMMSPRSGTPPLPCPRAFAKTLPARLGRVFPPARHLLAALSGRQIHFRGCYRTPRLRRLVAALSLTLSLFHYSHLPTPSPRLSSRPKRPDLFFRAAFWRVGPRSGGI